MFALAILIGIYSYLILALGLINLLYKSYIIWMTIVYLLFCIFWFRRSLMGLPRLRLRRILAMTITKVFLGIIIVQVLINFLGALGPELGFDALWYHLTIPKSYLENNSVFYIPGDLLYYSLMPKLTEMLYVGALALNGEILAKLIHFTFGILSCIALFKLSREFFSTKISLIAVVIFYSNLVVGWQSITAYVDLARTFFEIMAFWGFVNFWKKGEKKWMIESAVMLGLAISTKLLALGSLVIFSALIALRLFTSEESKLKGPPRRSPFGHLRGVANALFAYWFIALLIPFPWFVFSYINTGNPVYPFFTDIYKVEFNLELLNPIKFFSDIWGMYMKLSDPINPIYIIFLPLIFILFKKFKPEIKLIGFYCVLALLIWYFTPRTGGGRFIMPYLPAFSILVVATLEKIDSKLIKRCIIIIIIFISFISIIYRGIANVKYLPVVLGEQTKSEFLSANLNFSFGDFYDIDGYFKNNIKLNDSVLMYGFHNLYYVEFPFIDSSWVKKGDTFNFIVTQNAPLPKRFKDWGLVYQNLQTHAKLYSKGEIKWVY